MSVHRVAKPMDGLVRTTCGVYVCSRDATEVPEQVTCRSCVGEEDIPNQGTVVANNDSEARNGR